MEKTALKWKEIEAFWIQKIKITLNNWPLGYFEDLSSHTTLDDYGAVKF